MDGNLIHKWLCDPRFAPSDVEPEDDIEIADCLEVAVTARDFPISANIDVSTATGDLSATRVVITLPDGRRILIERATSLMAVVSLVQGLTA